MPTKYEIAEYLVNLHSLMEAQDQNAIAKSTTLANEYNANWGLLKELIQQENKDERD